METVYMPIDTDLLIIGGGPGGYVAALRAGYSNLKVTLVEARALGGVCLNAGCIPTKAWIDVSNIYRQSQENEECGIKAKDVQLDFLKLQLWKDDVVKRLRRGIQALLDQKGVQVVQGLASFIDRNTVLIERSDGEPIAYRFKYSIVATGSSPKELPGFPFDGEVVVDAETLLMTTNRPERLIIIGGGAIGLEIGTALAKMGTHVMLLEAEKHLLPAMDPELSSVVFKQLRRRGVEVYVGVKLEGYEKASESEVKVYFEENGMRRELIGDRILVSVGRRPNTKGLGLERLGVELDVRGYIRVDSQRRTHVPHVFAVGDVVSGPMLAHKASQEGIVAAEAIMGLPSAFDRYAIPWVVYSDPQVASVGLTESEAKSKGYSVVVGRFPFSASGRALTKRQGEGLIKIIANRDDNVVLGVSIVGPEASELIQEAALALEMGATLEDLALTVHAHPTLGEGLKEAAYDALKWPIHVYKSKRIEG